MTFHITGEQLAKAKRGAERMGTNSCATRHGHAECHCKRNPRPKLWCVRCQWWEVHEFAESRAIKAFDDEVKGFEQVWCCSVCGMRRRFGLHAGERQ